MANLTVRMLDDELLHKLRIRATSNGRSMEEEARIILTDVLEDDSDERGLATEIHELFAPIGGLELDIPPRDEMVTIPNLLK